MRKIIPLFFLFFSFISLTAQNFGQPPSGILDPIEWEATVEKQNDSLYHLVFTATMEAGWHLYSQEEVEEGGPIPTEFSFNFPQGSYELVGETREPDGVALFDPVFQMDIKYFNDEAIFVQPIKVLSDGSEIIEAEVYFMVCDDEQCLAPETVAFSLSPESGED